MQSATPTILIIEDHNDIADMVCGHLEDRGFVVDHAANGINGLHLATENDYDVIILDLMLPGMDGLDLCKQLRNDLRKSTPVIILSARDTLDDKISGLDSGADDYLTKPFNIQELEARLNALIRRSRGETTREALTVGSLKLDVSTLKVERNGQALTLPPIGLKLLSALMRSSPGVVSRRELERQVWGDILPDSDTLRSHLYILRKAIDKPFDKPMLHTVHGRGYKLVNPDANEQ